MKQFIIDIKKWKAAEGNTGYLVYLASELKKWIKEDWFERHIKNKDKRFVKWINEQDSLYLKYIEKRLPIMFGKLYKDMTQDMENFGLDSDYAIEMMEEDFNNYFEKPLVEIAYNYRPDLLTTIEDKQEQIDRYADKILKLMKEYKVKETREDVKKKIKDSLDHSGRVFVYICRDNQEVKIEEVDSDEDLSLFDTDDNIFYEGWD